MYSENMAVMVKTLKKKQNTIDKTKSFYSYCIVYCAIEQNHKTLHDKL